MRKRFEKLGKYLRQQRLKRGMSQSEVAKRLGYSTAQFISNWERGMSSPPVKTLRKLAQFYDISAGAMFAVVQEEFIRELNQEYWGSTKKTRH
jgi:transcriptional regulator with XRE-family HTH domain